MSKEPERRYDAAASLADDLDRWLQGRPIEARAPSLGYRARKLARRHATAIKGAAAVGLAAAVVVGFVVVNARGEHRAALTVRRPVRIIPWVSDLCVVN